MSRSILKVPQACAVTRMVLMVLASRGVAQDDVARTRNLPGIETATLPYVSPEDVGVSPASLVPP